MNLIFRINDLFQLLTFLVIVNAILFKVTEQVTPYVSKLLNKSENDKLKSFDHKSSEIIKQIKTLTPFQV